jgi:rhodanese-related sulfurtransferase
VRATTTHAVGECFDDWSVTQGRATLLGLSHRLSHMDHTPRFLAYVAAARARVREVTPSHVQELLRTGAARVFDVREESEWAAGHVAGAAHLGKGIIERDIERTVPELDEPIVLYCGGGYRSALAADALQQMGYTHVLSMAGGWRGWTEAGGQVSLEPSRS